MEKFQHLCALQWQRVKDCDHIEACQSIKQRMWENIGVIFDRTWRRRRQSVHCRSLCIETLRQKGNSIEGLRVEGWIKETEGSCTRDVRYGKKKWWLPFRCEKLCAISRRYLKWDRGKALNVLSAVLVPCFKFSCDKLKSNSIYLFIYFTNR